jgi:putative addiction module CopG family antidote
MSALRLDFKRKAQMIDRTKAPDAVDSQSHRPYPWLMQVDLTPAQASFIDLGIQEGRFRNSEEAIREALAQWEKRERARIELLASLDSAEQALDAGEGEEYTIETLSSLVQSVQERGIARLSER